MNQYTNSFMNCPKCGSQNKRDAVLCIKCGFNFHIQREQMKVKLKPERDLLDEQKKNRKSNIMLVISLLNIILIFPFLVKYSLLWKIFGDLKTPDGYFRYLLTSGYSVSSIIAVFFLTINFITKGKIYKYAVVAIVSFFLMGIIAAIVINRFDLL